MKRKRYANYSRVSNKRAGWNKHAGWKKSPNLGNFRDPKLLKTNLGKI